MLTPEENMNAEKHKDGVDELKANEALSSSPDCYGAPRPMASAPNDGTIILAWHKCWKCWLSVKWQAAVTAFPNGLEWLEATNAMTWPGAAFTHWMPAPKAPNE